MDWEKIASQLSHPTGEDGISTADMMYASNIGMIRNTIEALNLLKDDLVLEIGHGNGQHIDELLAKAEGIHYHGLEISELMHLTASKNITDSNASFKLYDGNTIPYEADYFTKILTVNTLYFWKDPVSLLNELYRILKPGGKCCCTFAEKQFMEKLPFTKFIFELYDVDKVEQLVKASNFNKTELNKYTEQLTDKGGESIERSYLVLSLVK